VKYFICAKHLAKDIPRRPRDSDCGIGLSGDWPSAKHIAATHRPLQYHCTAVEWYDFFIYATATALVFNKLFFPTSVASLSSIAAFATYAVGFFARPVGAAIFGHYGDRIGRKAMLATTIIIMGVGTFLIGLLPTYGQIGVAAPLLLVLLRLLQGIGLGGEWGGAVLMVVENAQSSRPAWQHGADRQPDRGARRHCYLQPRLKAAGPGTDVLGLAHTIPDQHLSGRHRFVHPPEPRGDPGVSTTQVE
jgi:hypothetical protein